MKCTRRIKGSRECRTSVCVIVLASVWLNVSVGSVQRVLSVWGKSLGSWVESPSGHTHKPHSPLAALLPRCRPIAVHTSWRPVFSLKLIFCLCSSLTCALAKHNVKNALLGRSSKDDVKKKKREKEWASFFVMPSIRQPQSHKEWDRRRKSRRGGSRGAYENDVDEDNL